jgi:hypothetical protein
MNYKIHEMKLEELSSMEEVLFYEINDGSGGPSDYYLLPVNWEIEQLQYGVRPKGFRTIVKELKPQPNPYYGKDWARFPYSLNWARVSLIHLLKFGHTGKLKGNY